MEKGWKVVAKATTKNEQFVVLVTHDFDEALKAVKECGWCGDDYDVVISRYIFKW